MERQFRNSCQLGQIEIVKDLISQGVDVKSKDQLGRDGLFWAAERGQVEIVKLLMSLLTRQMIMPTLPCTLLC